MCEPPAGSERGPRRAGGGVRIVIRIANPGSAKQSSRVVRIAELVLNCVPPSVRRCRCSEFRMRVPLGYAARLPTSVSEFVRCVRVPRFGFRVPKCDPACRNRVANAGPDFGSRFGVRNSGAEIGFGLPGSDVHVPSQGFQVRKASSDPDFGSHFRINKSNPGTRWVPKCGSKFGLHRRGLGSVV